MNTKIEITIDVIVHATEDISKIFQAFEEIRTKRRRFYYSMKQQDTLIIQ